MPKVDAINKAIGYIIATIMIIFGLSFLVSAMNALNLVMALGCILIGIYRYYITYKKNNPERNLLKEIEQIGEERNYTNEEL